MTPTILETYSRKRASLGMVSLNQLHYSNPWLTMAWSFLFPGFGHILLGEFTQGWIMFIWEMFVNVHANFNEAIMLAVTGRFHASITLLAAGGHFWILLYGTVYCYSIFGSYVLAVEANNIYALAFEENIPIEIFRINSFQFNYFNKGNPWIACAWSLLMPGLGGLYTRRVVSYVFELVWWMVIVYFSHLLPAIIYTFTGHFEQAISVLNVEWTMFIPTIYGFTFYHSYMSVAENNKLFDKQQANFLHAMYQSSTFPFRLKEGESQVRIISTLDHNLYLEKAISSIEKQGVPKDQIFAVPINKNSESSAISLDSMHHSDGKAMLDIPSLMASFFCALGTIYGFVLHWGPVLCGLVGFGGGFTLGFIIKFITVKLSGAKRKKHSKTEVVLMIDCEKDLANKIEQILWHCEAFGVSKVDT